MEKFPENAASNFTVEQTHEYDLLERSRYFMHLNSIHTSANLLHKPKDSDCHIAYSISTNYSSNLITGDFIQSLVSPKNELQMTKDSEDASVFDIKGSYYFTESMKKHAFRPAKSGSDLKLMLSEERVLHVITSFLSQPALGIACRFNVVTDSSSGGMTFSIGPLQEGVHKLVMTMPRYFRKALGFTKGQYFRTGEDSDSKSRSEGLTILAGEILTGNMPMKSAVFESTAPSRFYLECGACEGSVLEKESRRILRVVPIRRQDITDNYFHYECISPEHVLIDQNNIKHLTFKITDDSGEVLESINGQDNTVVVCSIVEE